MRAALASRSRKCTKGKENCLDSQAASTRNNFQQEGKPSGGLRRFVHERKSEALSVVRDVYYKLSNSAGGFKRSLSVSALHTKNDVDLHSTWRFGSLNYNRRPRITDVELTEAAVSSIDNFYDGKGLVRTLSMVQQRSESRGKKMSTLARNVKTRKRSYCLAEQDNSGPRQTNSSKIPPVKYGIELEKCINIGQECTIFDTSFSSNIWYYGEIEVVRGFRRTLCKSSASYGSMIVKRSPSEATFYTISYVVGSRRFSGNIPHIGGRYSMDFWNASEPRFSDIDSLIDYLIMKKLLKRVTFEWLVVNTCDWE